MLVAALVGFLTAMVTALPLTGPATVLVASAAVRGKSRRALELGAASALPEGVYAALACLGAGTVMSPSNARILAGLGGCVLVVVGVLLARGATWSRALHDDDGRAAILVGLASTGLNPSLLLTWGGVAATMFGLGLSTPGTGTTIAMGVGVALGNFAGYIILVAIFRRVKASPVLLRRIEGGLGVLLAVIGLGSVGRAWWG